MKKTFFSLALMATVFSGSAQVGIGVSGTVDASARFQINANSSTNAKGFLPPQIALTASNSHSPFTVTPATGLLIYNTAAAGSGATAVTPGFYYYSGSAWVRLIVPTDNVANVTGTVAVANGGTGATSAADARTNLGLVIGTNVLAPNGSAANLTSFPTLNQNTTGTASNVTGRVAVANGGTGSATGSITGTDALTFAAGGTNQNVTLTPSGTGNTVLNGNVGVGTTSPNAKLDIRTSPTSISDPGAGYLGIGTTSATAAAAGAGAVRYSTDGGAGLDFSNGAAWNRLTSAVVKSTAIASKIGADNEWFDHTVVTNVTNWTEILDVNNNFDPSTGIFTAPRTGNYIFNFSYKFRAGSIAANSKIEAFMTCSNVAKLRKTATAFPASGTSAEPGAQISFVVNLTAGETLRPSLWHSLGSNKQLLADDDFINLSIVEL